MSDLDYSSAQALMSLQEVAEFLKVPVGTLYRWRHQSIGPKGYTVGRHVRYDRRDVLAWLEEQADRPKIATG